MIFHPPFKITPPWSASRLRKSIRIPPPAPTHLPGLSAPLLSHWYSLPLFKMCQPELGLGDLLGSPATGCSKLNEACSLAYVPIGVNDIGMEHWLKYTGMAVELCKLYWQSLKCRKQHHNTKQTCRTGMPSVWPLQGGSRNETLRILARQLRCFPVQKTVLKRTSVPHTVVLCTSLTCIHTYTRAHTHITCSGPWIYTRTHTHNLQRTCKLGGAGQLF
jgi:hypothetical protein